MEEEVKDDITPFWLDMHGIQAGKYHRLGEQEGKVLLRDANRLHLASQGFTGLHRASSGFTGPRRASPHVTGHHQASSSLAGSH